MSLTALTPAEEMLTEVLGCLCATVFVVGLLTWVVITVILWIKQDAKKQEYLKSLTDEERVIIAKYEDAIKITIKREKK